MQKATIKKVKEIQEILNNGGTEKDVIKAKFKSSPKAYNEWMEKFGEHLKQNLVLTTGIPVSNSPSFELFSPTPKDIENLKLLLTNADKIMDLLEHKEYVEELNILEVPDELLKLNDIKISSVRLSKSIEEQFNTFVFKNKKYTKTSLMNMALIEFMEKYK